tara:strand:+ start:32039 stop:34405 length:2367 start_codon:yes stop_codon:yes gene_type:complete
MSKFNVRTRRIPVRRGMFRQKLSTAVGETREEAASAAHPTHYIENLCCAAVLIDCDRRIEAVNKEFFKLFGLPAKAVQSGETFAEFAQRSILNGWEGIIGLGELLGAPENNVAGIRISSSHGQTVTAKVAITPEEKMLISLSVVESSSDEDQWPRRMIDNLGGAILRIRLNPNGVLSCIFANASAPDLFGITNDVLLDPEFDVLTLVNEIHRDSLSTHIQDARMSSGHFDLDLQILNNDRGPIWTRCVGSTFENAEGENTCDVRLMDIEDRVAISNERQRLETLLNLIVDNIPLTVLVRDASTSEIIFANRACEELTGESRTELIGKMTANCFAGKKNRGREASRQRLIRTGKPEFYPEETISSPNLGERQIVSSSYPLNDQKGTIQYILTITEDITDQKATQSALVKSQERFDEAMAAFTNGLALFDSDDRLVLCNERYVGMWPRANIDLKPGVTYEALVTAFARQAIEHGQNIDLESYVKSRVEKHLNPPSTREVSLFDGRWLQVTDRRTAEGGIVVTCTDITSLKEKQDELKRLSDDALTAKETAELANKSKSDFLANMSHELRTPLNAIIGFSEIIRDALMGKDYISEYQEYAHDIHQSGNHLLALINDILDMSKIEAGELELAEELISLEEAIDIPIKLVAERATQNEIKLIANLPVEPVVLSADSRKIRQVIINLLSNAVKFSDPGGTVTTDVQWAEDGGILLSVTDTGIGIPEDEIQDVLEPFKQAHSGLDRKFEGTGLGLSLTKALVELHGGQLTLSSMTKGPEKGTKVTVKLPAERLVR